MPENIFYPAELLLGFHIFSFLFPRHPRRFKNILNYNIPLTLPENFARQSVFAGFCITPEI